MMQKDSNASISKNRDPINGKRIAIMGATSHIARGLIDRFVRGGNVSLFLFTRRTEPVHAFLTEIGAFPGKHLRVIEGYRTFAEHDFDVIISCVGLGTVSHEPHIHTSFFMVTEEFDNLAINYLTASPRTLCINFSSGAIYGNKHMEASHKTSINHIAINELSRDDCFMIAKLNSEVKHRAFEQLHIVDIRVFSYFSRFIDITGKYFITELLHALIHNHTFHTDDTDIVRDYIHPDDLFALVSACMDGNSGNTVFDAYSLAPTTKTDILSFFAGQYNLKYQIEKSSTYHNVTGHKNVYYSLYHKAGEIGYQPRHSSLDTIKLESAFLLQPRTTRGSPPAKTVHGEQGVV